MTTDQANKLIYLDYIDFWGDYNLSIAINEMYHKQYIYECDDKELFTPKAFMLTEIGKIVFKRLFLIRDLFGITPNFEIIKELFTKIKKDYSLQPNQINERLLIQSKIEDEIKLERYEQAEILKRKL